MVHLIVLNFNSTLSIRHSPVSIYEILTVSSELARIRFTLVDLRLAQVSRISWTALAREAVLSVNARSAVTRIRLAVVDVRLTGDARVTRWTFARVTGYRIVA